MAIVKYLLFSAVMFITLVYPGIGSHAGAVDAAPAAVKAPGGNNLPEVLSTWKLHAVGVNATGRIKFIDNGYVIPGLTGELYTSIDGTTWSVQATGIQDDLVDITFGNGVYVIAGSSGSIYSKSSLDPGPWSVNHTGAAGDFLEFLAFAGGLFSAGGSSFTTSSDSFLWQVQELPLPENLPPLPGLWQGQNIAFYVSDDSMYIKREYGHDCGNYQTTYRGGNPYVYDTQGYDVVFVAYNNAYQPSSDWTPVCGSFPITNNEFSAFNENDQMDHAEGRFISGTRAIGWAASRPFYSVSWEAEAKDNPYPGLRDMIAAKTARVTVGEGIWSAPEGQPWSRVAEGTYSKIAFNDSRYVAVGASGIVTSPDAVVWSAAHSPIEGRLNDIVYFNGYFVAVGAGGTVISSPDGQSWASHPTGITTDLLGVAAVGQRLLATGADGTIYRTEPVMDAVDGMCGSSGGKEFTASPQKDLCASGDASAVDATSTSFTWSCAGLYGGETSSCSATRIYMITPRAGTGGSIDPATPQSVLFDGSVVFSVVADAGYHIEAVTGCGGSLSGATYTTGPARSSCTVTAAFAENVPPADGACGLSHGRFLWLAPRTEMCAAGTASVVETGKDRFIWTCSGSNGGSNSDCSASRLFLVTSVAGKGGVVQPAIPQDVLFHETVAFSILPAEGYHVVSVTGCGGTMSGTTYTTAGIEEDCTVAAGFAEDAPAVVWTTGKTFISAGYKAVRGKIAVSAVTAGALTAVTLSCQCSASWIDIVGDGTIIKMKNGRGAGKVSYTLAENPTSSPRSALITIDGKEVVVEQAGAPCLVKGVLASSKSFDPSGGTLTAKVTAPEGCMWSFVVPPEAGGWLKAGSSGGSGTETVILTAGENRGSMTPAKYVKAKTRKTKVYARAGSTPTKSVTLMQKGI